MDRIDGTLPVVHQTTFLDWPKMRGDMGHTQSPSLPRPPSVSCSVAQAYLCDLGVSVLKCLGCVALQQDSGPVARPRFPWQCPTLGLSRGPHKPLECLKNTTLQANIQTASPRRQLSIGATGKSFQSRVLIFSSENRWPPLQSSPSALFFPFPPPLSLQSQAESELRFQYFHFFPVL